MANLAAAPEQTVVVLTGAGNGIGYRLAKSLLVKGYRVAALDLSTGNLTEMEQAYPEHLLITRCDVTRQGEVNQAVEAVLVKWGQIDVLVNNAALAIFKPFQERDIEETRREFEVNYFGYLRMIYAVLPHMKARGQGIIHNMSSGVGISGFPGISGYASTKGAIESLTRTLALELDGTGITVNLMQPPLTQTQSSAPLGVPREIMADPVRVGEKLAAQIMSRKPVISTDFGSAAGLFAMRLIPVRMGKLLATATAKARAEGKAKSDQV